jgi:hypothetical protein
MFRAAGMLVAGLLTLSLWGSAPSACADGDKKPDSSETLDTVLRGLGVVTAGYLYHAHQDLGHLAQAARKAGEINEKLLAKIREILALTKLVLKHFAKIEKTSITEEDQKELAKVRAITALLGQQTEQLIVALETKKASHFARFERRRAETWKAIARFLELEDDPKPEDKPKK